MPRFDGLGGVNWSMVEQVAVGPHSTDTELDSAFERGVASKLSPSERAQIFDGFKKMPTQDKRDLLSGKMSSNEMIQRMAKQAGRSEDQVRSYLGGSYALFGYKGYPGGIPQLNKDITTSGRGMPNAPPPPPVNDPPKTTVNDPPGAKPTGDTMLILRGIAGRDYPRGALDEQAATDYARALGYNPRVLDVPGTTGPQSEQTQMALEAISEDPSIHGLYGFSGGGYNVRHIINQMTPAQKEQLRQVTVLGAPKNPESAYRGPWNLTYRTDPPSGHMAGPKALLSEVQQGNTAVGFTGQLRNPKAGEDSPQPPARIQTLPPEPTATPVAPVGPAPTVPTPASPPSGDMMKAYPPMNTRRWHVPRQTDRLDQPARHDDPLPAERGPSAQPHMPQQPEGKAPPPAHTNRWHVQPMSLQGGGIDETLRDLRDYRTDLEKPVRTNTEAPMPHLKERPNHVFHRRQGRVEHDDKQRQARERHGGSVGGFG